MVSILLVYPFLSYTGTSGSHTALPQTTRVPRLASCVKVMTCASAVFHSWIFFFGHLDYICHQQMSSEGHLDAFHYNCWRAILSNTLLLLL